jgi:hypothetical protein
VPLKELLRGQKGPELIKNVQKLSKSKKCGKKVCMMDFKLEKTFCSVSDNGHIQLGKISGPLNDF